MADENTLFVGNYLTHLVYFRSTRYGLDGPGIESRWGRDFLYPFKTALGPAQPPIQWEPGLSRG